MSPGVIFGCLSLGQLIDRLSKCPPNAHVWVGSGCYRAGEFRSYRGYYEDLALGFGSTGEPERVADLLKRAVEALGKDHAGWKGGEYRAMPATAVWLDNPGSARGVGLVDVTYIPGVGVELVSAILDP